MATHCAVHLLTQILVFNPRKRLSCIEALCHPYLEEGRMRYHSFLCDCCYHSTEGFITFCRGDGASCKYSQLHVFVSADMEPNSLRYFDPSFERSLTSVGRVRQSMFEYIQLLNKGKDPLFINVKSKNFKQFQKWVMQRSCLIVMSAFTSLLQSHAGRDGSRGTVDNMMLFFLIVDTNSSFMDLQNLVYLVLPVNNISEVPVCQYCLLSLSLTCCWLVLHTHQTHIHSPFHSIIY